MRDEKREDERREMREDRVRVRVRGLPEVFPTAVHMHLAAFQLYVRQAVRVSQRVQVPLSKYHRKRLTPAFAIKKYSCLGGGVRI
jgi:hypothetical protein